MRKHSWVETVSALKTVLAACLALASSGSSAQGERWFTFEVSVFSNELASDRGQELPIKRVDAALNNGPAISLTQFFDLLNIAQWPDQTANQTPTTTSPEPVSEPLPEPLAVGEKSYQFVDLMRDPLIALSSSASDFQQTNRALERSPDYRLLAHEVWRQPLADEGKSTPIRIVGERQRAGGFELEGTIDLHFNSRQDRIALDTNLVLEANSAGDLVFHHKQSREMRSTEFHYLDSPAIGVIILAQPYEVPPLDPQNAATEFGC